jgi:hypothetical protein
VASRRAGPCTSEGTRHKSQGTSIRSTPCPFCLLPLAFCLGLSSRTPGRRAPLGSRPPES